jgi:hypothetical protein
MPSRAPIDKSRLEVVRMSTSVHVSMPSRCGVAICRHELAPIQTFYQKEGCPRTLLRRLKQGESVKFKVWKT